MPTISPLASLYQVLQTARTNAQTHAELLRKNEAATRAALIDPILRALGWDTTNVQVVEPEKTINTAWRADYALHDSTGKIDLLLEAKCLDSNLEKFSVVQQLLSYAFGFGVLKVVVTDGIKWHFYTEFKPGTSIADSQFNLLHDDIIVCALQLIQWLDAAQSGHGLVKLTNSEQAVHKKEHNTSNPIAMLSEKVEAQKNRILSLKRTSKSQSADFIELTDLQSLALHDGQKPKQLRLPNGTIKPISTWKAILLEVCKLVLQTNTKLKIPFPDKAGKKTFLFTNQKPLKASSTLETYKAMPVFIYTNYDKYNCIANALYASAQLPPNQKSATLAVSF